MIQVYRAAKLYMAKRVISDHPGKISLVKEHNWYTGKETRDTDFSVNNYGEATKTCMVSAQKIDSDKIWEVYDLAGAHDNGCAVSSSPRCQLKRELRLCKAHRHELDGMCMYIK